MNISGKHAAVTILLLAVVTLFLVSPVQSAEDIKGEGLYILAPNGDASISIKLTPPMIMYQKMRESVSNLYLVMRILASDRADAEITDKKADWDDSNRTMAFSMKVLGAAKNFGDHWEIEIPKGTQFINVDEAKRTFYFNETAPAGGIATIRGTSKLVMPAEAQKFKWEESKRVVNYTMPPPKTSTGRDSILLIGAVASILAGAGLTIASFRIKG